MISPCSSVFPFCPTLTVECLEYSLGTVLKNYCQFETGTCLSGLPVPAFSELRKMFIYIMYDLEHGDCFSSYYKTPPEGYGFDKVNQEKKQNIIFIMVV